MAGSPFPEGVGARQLSRLRREDPGAAPTFPVRLVPTALQGQRERLLHDRQLRRDHRVVAAGPFCVVPNGEGVGRRPTALLHLRAAPVLRSDRRRLGEKMGTSPTRQRSFVELLREHHDLRVRALDAHRLVLSLRLDQLSLSLAATGTDGVIGQRLVFTTIAGKRAPSGPLSPRQPYPGDKDRSDADGRSTVELTEMLKLINRQTETADQWSAKMQEQAPACGCGCGEQLRISPRHRAPSKGVPRFIQGHHQMDMTKFVEALNAEGYLTIRQAAKVLSMSESALRRAEARGEIRPERRRWGRRAPMRVYMRDGLSLPKFRPHHVPPRCGS